MGYATVRHLPTVFNYQTALKIYNSNEPIRGRKPEIRPFGRRKDADTYSIRKNGEAIELVLYKTPVITIHDNDEVEVFINGYATVSTHQFIGQVLGAGVSASGVRRTTVLTIDKNKYTIADEDKLRLKYEGGNWHVLNAKTQWGWRLRRAEVTNVRAKYGEFYKYLKGFVNLRTERIKPHRWSDIEVNVVNVQVTEYKEVFGNLVSLRAYTFMNKRGKQHIRYVSVSPEQYRGSSEAFECLIRPDQPEEHKHTNFYKAALLLVAKCDDDAMDIRADSVVATAKHIVPTLDEVLFMMNADTVLERYELAMGKVSSGIYEDWMKGWE